jgi:DNA-binding XRE family transcriptional regulator
MKFCDKNMIVRDIELLQYNIVRKRNLSSITQSELAANVGVSIGTLNRWERESFRSTKLRDLLKVIAYMESRGVKF